MSDESQMFENECWKPIGATYSLGAWQILFTRFSDGKWEFQSVSLGIKHIGQFDDTGPLLRSRSGDTEVCDE